MVVCVVFVCFFSNCLFFFALVLGVVYVLLVLLVICFAGCGCLALMVWFVTC